MRLIIAILLASTLSADAQSSLTIQGSTSGTFIGPTMPTTGCVGIAGDGCVPSDLVIRTRADRVILVRKIYGCKDLATKLIASADVASAECFQ